MHLYGAIHSEAGPVLDLQQEVGAQRPVCRTWPEFPDRLRLCKSRCLAALAAVLDQDKDQDIQYCTLYSTRQPANLRLEYVQAAISRPRRCACFTCFDLFSPQIRFLSQIYGPGPGGIILFPVGDYANPPTSILKLDLLFLCVYLLDPRPRMLNDSVARL